MRAAQQAQHNNQHEAAIKLFEQAFSQGAYEAFLPLARYYYNAEYKNDTRINALIKQLEQASEQGHTNASEMARKLFLSNEFTNKAKAFHHAQLAAANSTKDTEQWVEANMLLAELYFAGLGTAKNSETGFNTMKRVAYSNGKPNLKVHVQLGLLYGRQGNIDESAKWFNSAINARAGYKKDAKSLISDIYYQLGINDHSVQAAFEYFEGKPLTAEQLNDLKTFAAEGDQDVQLALAMAYGYGEGMAKNQQMAELYFQQAITNDDLASLKAYIEWLDYYVDTTHAKAFPYVLRAAKKNDPKSMGRVSDHYLKGIGTAVNYGAARDWAARAIRAGLEDAENELVLALLMSTPPSSTHWYSYTQNTRGGKLYTASSANYGPMNLSGRRIKYVLNLTKYGSIQTQHYGDILFSREYTNFVTAYKVDCRQRELQEIGCLLLNGDKLVYEALDSGRWGWGKPDSTSTTSRLLQRICN
jgi:TPR repeat protein